MLFLFLFLNESMVVCKSRYSFVFVTHNYVIIFVLFQIFRSSSARQEYAGSCSIQILVSVVHSRTNILSLFTMKLECDPYIPLEFIFFFSKRIDIESRIQNWKDIDD